MIYRKRGIAIRWENGTVIRVREEGVAREHHGTFECEPAATTGNDLANDAVDLHAIADAVRNAARGVAIERLVIAQGRSEHQYGERRWSESTERVHLALTNARLRVLVDLASFDVDTVADVAGSLRRLDATRSIAPAALRIAPHVTAALLPLFIARPPEGTRIVQAPGGVDGYGEPIVEALADWPNAFRPSYRVPPRRMPMNLRIEGADLPIDPSLPRASAYLGTAADGAVRLLVDDGEHSWPMTIRIERVRAVAPPAAWHPYAAGSFGAEMML